MLKTTDRDGKNHEKIISREKRGTVNGNQLQAVIDAVSCLNRPCMVDIYVPSDHIVAAWKQGWTKLWQQSGGKNAKGKTVRNWKEWEVLLKLLTGHSVRFYEKEKTK